MLYDDLDDDASTNNKWMDFLKCIFDLFMLLMVCVWGVTAFAKDKSPDTTTCKIHQGNVLLLVQSIMAMVILPCLVVPFGRMWMVLQKCGCKNLEMEVWFGWNCCFCFGGVVFVAAFIVLIVAAVFVLNPECDAYHQHQQSFMGVIAMLVGYSLVSCVLCCRCLACMDDVRESFKRFRGQ